MNDIPDQLDSVDADGVLSDPNVRAVSVAAQANEGQSVQARAWGITRDTGPAVAPDTLFSAGSISKPVTALAALRLVADGLLSLDEDVNERLRSWKVPPNGSWQPTVTLRQLLSHRAGTTTPGFLGYGQGDPLPSVIDVLDGTGHANSPAVRVEILPGLTTRYSGGGSTIVQLLVEETTGASFADAVHELVLQPAGMSRSVFSATLPPGVDAAHGHDGGGPVPGGARTMPELAAAGLWTTPTDLLHWVAAVRAAHTGAAGAILPQPLAREMLAPNSGPFGLGPQLTYGPNGARFGHGGMNVGFTALVEATVDDGPAAAVMINSSAGPAPLNRMFSRVAAALGWTDIPSQPKPPAGQPTAAPTGRYVFDDGTKIDIAELGLELIFRGAGQRPIALEQIGPTTWQLRTVRAQLDFDAAGGTVTLSQFGQNYQARRARPA